MKQSRVRGLGGAFGSIFSRQTQPMHGRALRRCNSVGVNPTVYGEPHIVNDGTIEIGARLRLWSRPVTTHLVAEWTGRIMLGDDVTIGHGSGLASHSGIRIGNGTCLGAFVLIMDSDYHVPGDSEADAVSTPITIGNNVRIGHHVTILRGSNIADDAKVLDGSVITGNVDRGTCVAGVPARPVRGDDALPDNPASFNLEERLALVAARTLRLSEAPGLDVNRSEIPAWDSLAALNFMLALEEEFAVILAEDDMIGANTLGDIARVLNRARRAASEQPPEGGPH